MATGFTRSVVLTQDSPGVRWPDLPSFLTLLSSWLSIYQHSSLAAPSVCTVTYIRDYFVNGTLPDPGTICPVIGSPFDRNTTGQAIADRSLAADDKDILDTVRALSRSFRLPIPLWLCSFLYWTSNLLWPSSAYMFLSWELYSKNHFHFVINFKITQLHTMR